MDQQPNQFEQSKQAQHQSPILEHKHFLNKKFAITMLVLVSLISVAYAGIWYWQKQQLAQEVVPTFTPRPSALADPTANWKTYTNTQYGFEFKYPDNLSVCDIIPPKPIGTGNATYITRVTYSVCGGVADLNLPLNKAGSGGIIIWTGITQDLKSFVFGQYETKDLQFITSLEINKIPTFVYKYIPTNGDTSGISTSYFFIIGNKIVEINASSPGSQYPSTWIPVFDQILSTFKFIDSKETDYINSVDYRDMKRYLEVYNIRVVLELYFDDNQKYPGALGELKKKISPNIDLLAPLPSDGNCSESDNLYKYTQLDNGKSYNLQFCLGQIFNGKESYLNVDVILAPGIHVADPSGIK